MSHHILSCVQTAVQILRAHHALHDLHTTLFPSVNSPGHQKFTACTWLSLGRLQACYFAMLQERAGSAHLHRVLA